MRVPATPNSVRHNVYGEPMRADERADKLAAHDHPVWKLLDQLQMDNREQAGQLALLRSLLLDANLAPPKSHKCPTCGTRFRSGALLEEHAFRNHDGPLPSSYAAAEKAAGFTT